MVYDREMGSMRVLLTSPSPRWFLLLAKLFASTFVSIFQVYAFLLVASIIGIRFQPAGYLFLLPAVVMGGMMLGAAGLFLSSLIKQLENFAGVMNFVIFPAFFLSSALYPLWKMRESSVPLFNLCNYNPFTYVVELIRFALYSTWNGEALLWVATGFVIFAILAIMGYDPRRGFTSRHVA